MDNQYVDNFSPLKDLKILKEIAGKAVLSIKYVPRCNIKAI